MIEALWSVSFNVPQHGNGGAGVVVLENGLARGGDSTYFYIGDFSVKDEVVTANIKVKHYAGPKNNVFGSLDEVNLTLQGRISYDSFMLTGNAKEVPASINVTFNRIAEISA